MKPAHQPLHLHHHPAPHLLSSPSPFAQLDNNSSSSSAAGKTPGASSHNGDVPSSRGGSSLGRPAALLCHSRPLLPSAPQPLSLVTKSIE